MPKLKTSIRLRSPEKILERGSHWATLGTSSGGHPIICRHLKASGSAQRILLIGGVHGNETEGVQFMHEFCQEFADDHETSPFDQEILLIPVMNPYGVLNYQRVNANQVDLNRNMPTRDWRGEFTEKKYYPGQAANSEPETRSLVKLIDSYKPQLIISFHSWKPLINYNGPAVSFARKMNERLGMEITGDIGYPTPGSLGTYAGSERGIPTITFEFPRGMLLEETYPMLRQPTLDSFSLLNRTQ